MPSTSTTVATLTRASSATRAPAPTWSLRGAVAVGSAGLVGTIRRAAPSTSAWPHSNSQGTLTQRRPASVYENGSVVKGAPFSDISRPACNCHQIDEWAILLAEATNARSSTPRTT